MDLIDSAQYYFKEFPAKHFAEYLTHLFQTENVQASFWVKDDLPLNFDLDLSASQPDRYVAVKSPKRALNVLANDYLGKNIFFKVKTQTEQFFVSCKVVESLELNFYYLVYTSEIYKATQRQNYRYRCKYYDTIYIVANNSYINCYDISVGGTSLIVNQDQAALFPAGKEIGPFNVFFDNVEYSGIKAKVVNIFEYDKKEGQVKIGLQFHHLNRKIEAELWKKVNDFVRSERLDRKSVRR